MASEAGSPDLSDLLWPTLSLRELIDNGDAELQTGPFGTMLHAEAYRRSGVPVVAVKNIGDNRLLDDDIPRVDSDTALRLERYRLLEGDIVFGRKGAVDRRALVKADQEGWLQGSDCIRLRLNRRTINPRFVSFVLGSPFHRAWIIQQAHGATMPSLNQEILSRLPLPVPKVDEQQNIAAVLGALDDKIELNRKMNETLEALARALFKSWFVDFDPIYAKAEGRDTGLPESIAALFPDSFEDSEFGEIPRGWTPREADEDFDITMGQSPPGDTYNEQGDGLPFFQGRTDFGFRFPRRRVYCTGPTRVAQPGDTLVSVRAPVGDINMAIERCCIGRGVAAVRHRSGYRSFTFYSMRSLKHVFDVFEAEGTVFGSIGKKDFHAIKRPSPPRKLIAEFERLVSPLDEQVRSKTEQSSVLESLRNSLLPKLISGEIRIDRVERG
jgi:type I restriction enzyme S subunit